METTKTHERLKITIRRPEGHTEIVYKDDNVRYLGANKDAQKKCIIATREAGRGDILNFEIIEEQVPMTLEEQRAALVYKIAAAWDRWSYNRERDYDNDMGLVHSAGDEAAAKAYEQELKDFDEAHPELAAEIARKRAEETERNIQSALNA